MKSQNTIQESGYYPKKLKNWLDAFSDKSIIHVGLNVEIEHGFTRQELCRHKCQEKTPNQCLNFD